MEPAARLKATKRLEMGGKVMVRPKLTMTMSARTNVAVYTTKMLSMRSKVKLSFNIQLVAKEFHCCTTNGCTISQILLV